MSELRRKMVEELQLRNYSPHTQRAYLRCVADFAQHFKAAPDKLGPEHVREYQLFLVQRQQLSWSPFNQAVCALRFFYHHVLHRNWMLEAIPYPRHEQKLPVVLSPAEVAALFQSTLNLKHRTILMTIYAAGLRVSELINLRVTDIDSQRQLIVTPKPVVRRIGCR
jgi:site-specific recombinase XerD